MPQKTYTAAFSSCPNDTLIFHALLHGLVDVGDLRFESYLSDVEDLNLRAFDERFPLTKLSFHAWLLLRERYRLLDAGAALGYGCGPLLVSRDGMADLRGKRIAIPGIHTTAHLLLQLWHSGIGGVVATTFDRILDGVAAGEYDAGLIIHEGRFVYQRYGLKKIVDLGEWWEEETGLPIPLGCIAASRALPEEDIRVIEDALRASVRYGLANREASREFIRAHAQEMEDGVIEEHINLYVNDFSVTLGERGRRAIAVLEDRARKRGIIG